jgi:hypothetical protein
MSALALVPKAWYSWDFSVIGGNRTLAVLDLSAWRERADIMIDGGTHRVFREGAVSGDFIIERGGLKLARATKPSAFRNMFIVHYNGRDYTLRKRSVWGRTFELMDGERQIGSIERTSWWTRRAAADLPSDWPVPVKAFVIWLAIILWKREASSGAGA